MVRQISSPRSSFAFALAMNILGPREPQQQATITRKICKFPEISLGCRFRFSTERNPKSKIPGLLFQQFPRVTRRGSLPSEISAEPRKPPRRAPRRPCRTRRDPCRGPCETSERRISSESLAEGCAPRTVTLRKFKSYLIRS